MKKIFLAIAAAFTILAISLLIYFIQPIDTKHNIKLPSNSNSKNIDYLINKGYKLSSLDKLFLNFYGKSYKGWLYINKKRLPRYKFLIELTKEINYYTPFTIIPGETSYFVLKNLANKLHYNLNKLMLTYQKNAIYREGNFLADTYHIPNYFNEEKTVNFLIKNSFKEYKKISFKYYKKFDLKQWKRVIVVASILEKEAANKNEMPLIASVIYNRLNKNMKLQMDGTLNYGAYSHSKITPKRIKTDKSRYNTYKYKGLPNEPVCNVSKTAIIAAINPKDTKYLYFMKNSKGTHNFSINYKEHIKNIKLRKKELKK